MATRRQFGLGFGAAIAAGTVAWRARAAQADPWPEALGRQFAAIEARCGGRLGVGVLDTGTGRTAGHRGHERFPMCSTHKALSAAAVLARVDRGEDRLDRRVRFGAGDVLSYSPGTKAHAGGDGMALAAICEAAVTLSDNTAANLMLDAIGGPAGLTAFLRGLGDADTRLDRTEPGPHHRHLREREQGEREGGVGAVARGDLVDRHQVHPRLGRRLLGEHGPVVRHR